MNTSYFKDFITKNTAPPQATKIGIYNSKGTRVGGLDLGNLTFPIYETKQYSFGAISDLHLQRNTGTEDFTTALDFFENEGVEFICIDGDLTQSGTIDHLTQYKEYVDTYSPNVPIYAITGNHETYGGLDLGSVISTYTGQPLYYSFTKGNDVFIMVGIKGEVTLFADGELQWLYETLEANRNKRCFVFMHVLPGNGNIATCGNAYGSYNNLCWTHATQPSVFISLLQHYKNTVWFHGHSHFKFSMQVKDCTYANYDEADGYKSIHIPSITVPRDDANLDGETESLENGSEGYVVDVYSNGIHLKGRDFVNGVYLPIASYWIDTTLQTISPNTFTDSTGTITT